MRVYFLAALTFLFSIAGHTAVRPCSGEALPSISVTQRLIQPTVDHSVPRVALALNQGPDAGSTDSMSYISFDASLVVSPEGRRGLCLLGKVNVQIFAPSAAVYVAQEVPTDSCRFRAVYDHELKKVMLAQRVLDESVGPLSSVISTAVSDVLEHEAEAHLVAAMKQKIEAVVADYLVTEVVPLFASYTLPLNSAQEAERLSLRCSD